MFVKFQIHLTVLGKLVVDVCFCLQTCISAVVMAVVIYVKFDCSPLYNVLRSVGAHAQNNFTRAETVSVGSISMFRQIYLFSLTLTRQLLWEHGLQEHGKPTGRVC